jgi:shikimate kinase
MLPHPTPLTYNGIIFFIGFMGCGKSRLGKKLAAKTNRPFIDLDALIEQNEGKTITQIFSEIGENKFRELEKTSLQNSTFPSNAIVSTGGGAPCFFDNMQWMNAHGLTFFLDRPIAILASRLINGKSKRPLIEGKTQQELLNYIETKLIERRPYYQKATISLQQADITPEMVIETINKKF